MIYLYAFLVGGALCAFAELILELFKLTPGHLTCLFVSIGAFLEIGGFYDKLVKVAGAGALLPITSFGHSLAHAAYEGAKTKGILGLSSEIFSMTSNGIVIAVVFAVLLGLLFKPKG